MMTLTKKYRFAATKTIVLSTVIALFALYNGADAREPLADWGKIKSFNSGKPIPIIIDADSVREGETLPRQLSPEDVAQIPVPVTIEDWDRRANQIGFYYDKLDRLIWIKRRFAEIEFSDKPKIIDPTLCDMILAKNTGGTSMSSSSREALKRACKIKDKK